MIYYTRVEKVDKPVGLFGVDEIGRLQCVGQKGLISVLQTFFDAHHNFKIRVREGDMILEQVIEPRNQLKWIKEFRRQIPAPYYGAQILELTGTLDQLTSEWELLSG